MLIGCRDVILVITAGHPSWRCEHLNGAEQLHLSYCLQIITLNLLNALSKDAAGGDFHLFVLMG